MESKMDRKTVKYQYYKNTKRSFITIPRTLAMGLNWDNSDEINILFENLKGINGLFLYKKKIDDKFKDKIMIKDILYKIAKELYDWIRNSGKFTEWEFDYLFKRIMTESMRSGEGIILERDFKLAFKYFIKHNLIEIKEQSDDFEIPSKFIAKHEILLFFEKLSTTNYIEWSL